jgi:hypothetical protein
MASFSRLPNEENKDGTQFRLCLEQWLVSICENPGLCSNPDLKEFLSYEMSLTNDNVKNTIQVKILLIFFSLSQCK